MIADRSLLEEFEKEQISSSKAHYFRNLCIFEALLREAKSLGIFPPKNPLEGIEVDLRLARAMNVPKTAGHDRPETD